MFVSSAANLKVESKFESYRCSKLRHEHLNRDFLYLCVDGSVIVITCPGPLCFATPAKKSVSFTIQSKLIQLQKLFKRKKTAEIHSSPLRVLGNRVHLVVAFLTKHRFRHFH